MAESQNLALSLKDEDKMDRSDMVNDAHAAIESQNLEHTPRIEESLDLENATNNEDLVDSGQVNTDEWWNHVHSLVKSDEAKEPDHNSNTPSVEGISKELQTGFNTKGEEDAGKKNKRVPCPEDQANFLSRLTFWWFTGFVITGYKRPIDDSDIWAQREPYRASKWVPLLKGSWEEEQRRCYSVANQEDPSSRPQEANETMKSDLDLYNVKYSSQTKKTRKPSLVRALFKVFWRNSLLVASLKAGFDIVQFIQPQLLEMLIEYVEDKNNQVEAWKGYIFAVAMFFTGLVQSFLLQYYFHTSRSLEMKIKSALVGLIYEKALVLNSASRRQSTAGEMVNLMSIDAARVSDLVTYVDLLWSGPFQILIAIYFLSVTMGISILAGIGILLLLIPVNLLVTKLARRQQIKQMLKKDSRIVLMDEVLSGIKALKLYAWEESFLGKIMQTRNAELKYLRNAFCLTAITEFTFTCAPFLVSFAMFGVYILTGNELTASKALVALSLINIIRFPFTALPNAIVSFVQSLVSIKRMTEFLNLGEINPESIQRTIPKGISGLNVYVKDGFFSWGKDEPPVLESINMNIPSGSLVAVVGPVGSGKSSLLSALLGETEKLEGSVAVEGSVAYVPQQAWMQNATLRDNITFGKPFNSRVYQKVVDACALKTDLEILSGGDMTEIGERGINLSGGQKQRISLARAVYFSADVYFLDDALSAVDAHVGKHIFEKVIGPKGILRKKTRVVVSHNVSFLPQVDKIIVLKDRSISEEGTYAELMANEGEFAEFVITYTAKQQQEEQEERSVRGHTFLQEIQEVEKGRLDEYGETNEDGDNGRTNGIQTGEIAIMTDDYDAASSSNQEPEARKRSRSRTILEGIQESENEDNEDDDDGVDIKVDPGSPDGSERARSRKQPIAPKFLSVPNVTRHNSAQGGQFTNAGDSSHSRVRSWTLPTKASAGNEEKAASIAPVSFGRLRSRTTLESNHQLEQFERVLNLWIPKNREREGSHCERMRKISNMRGLRPRISRVTRGRSETVLSTTSWQDIDIDEQPRRIRAESILSTTTITGDEDHLSSSLPYDTAVEMMTSKEVSKEGAVKLSVFWTYIKSTTGCLFISFLLFLLFAECWSTAARIWLAHWTSSSANSTTEHTRDLGIYGGLGFSQAVFILIACFVQAFGSVMASRKLHHELLINILHSPMTFFETTPLGRIVNRFSKDIDIIDDLVPRTFVGFLRSSLELLAAICTISFAMPLFLAVILPLGIFYFFVQRVYAATSRQLRRIESISRSPLYNHFFETLNGVSTIRAYSQQQRFIQENFSKTDENQLAFYPTVISFRWLGLRLDFIGNCAILFAALFAAVTRDKLESGLAGLSIVYALQITTNLSWMVRKGTELESSVVSVERVKEYSETAKEEDWIISDSRPPNEWPQYGNIMFKDFDLKYREGLPLVLKQITCVITPGEKIGIVGRTGAGKSTLTQALFRILERAGGNIFIDDIDIATIGLHDLRSRLTIIPQDPVLFSGTLRLNMDPLGRHTDEELWQILEASHLKRFVAETERGLQFVIVEGGDNLSVGQRQLVCLARALLRKGKILILDEATSAVDLETDELIQQTIRREFADCTVFTIAHRLNTIMDYTRIMVLDKGFVVEFDTPINLLAQKGIFYSMAQEAGIA